MSALPDVPTGSDEPIYNIGVAARMTGLSMATLRAWERRYDFPEAERTAGGHRLYTERDVLRLRWVKARIDEGMQTAQAINALRHQEELGHFKPTAGGKEASEIRPHESENHLDAYQRRLYEWLKRRDLHHADNVLGEALTLYSPEELILDVIRPVFAAIGEGWEKGEISVATEHLATNHLRQRLLLWMLNGPPPRPVKPIVLACAPNEWHEGSLLILGALLRRRRWPVAYLGQAVPLADLSHFVLDFTPALVVLVAMTEQPAKALFEWPVYLPEVAKQGRPIIGYGGLVYRQQPDFRQRTAGVYLGDTLEEGVKNIERLLESIY